MKINGIVKNAAEEKSLIKYIDEGNFSKVKELVEAGVDVNKADKDMVTPLIAAASYKNSESLSFEMAKFLLENGADPNLTGGDDESEFYAINVTPLYIASANGNIKVIKLLLEYGVDINGITATSDFGNTTPLTIALITDNFKVASFLISCGADVNVGYPLSCSDIIDNLKRVKFLIDNGADVNIFEDVDNAPLIQAIENDDPEIVKLLVEKGADTSDPEVQEYLEENDLI